MIVLVRHGEAENARGRAIGHTDLPLSRTGEIQASVIAESLSGCSFETFLCSPLLRTVRTAEVVSGHIYSNPVHCPEIAEINLGQWDGQKFEKIKADFPDEYRKRGQDIAGYRPPGGESFIDLRDRVSPILSELSQQKLPALMVTHAGVIRIIINLILDFPLENIFRIKPAHCHATVITRKNNSYTLNGYNIPAGPGLNALLAKMMSQQT